MDAGVPVVASQLAHALVGTLEALLGTVVGKLVALDCTGLVLDGQEHVKLLANGQDVQCLAQKLAGKLVGLCGDALAKLGAVGISSHAHPLVIGLMRHIIPAAWRRGRGNCHARRQTRFTASAMSAMTARSAAR